MPTYVRKLYWPEDVRNGPIPLEHTRRFVHMENPSKGQTFAQTLKIKWYNLVKVFSDTCLKSQLQHLTPRIDLPEVIQMSNCFDRNSRYEN